MMQWRKYILVSVGSYTCNTARHTRSNGTTHGIAALLLHYWTGKQPNPIVPRRTNAPRSALVDRYETVLIQNDPCSLRKVDQLAP
jgi:hypothetical protein